MITKYIAGMQGGRCMINIGIEHVGKRYTRTTWADGKVVFTPVMEEHNNED